ncbi:MAG: hypothetical protein JWQ59_2440 [Cryobacterium sp.]|jgi:hypothetical protein|nr:hypothetical protein [Cryobacterium sp.]
MPPRFASTMRGIAYDREGDSLSVADPWGNSVRLTVAGM